MNVKRWFCLMVAIVLCASMLCGCTTGSTTVGGNSNTQNNNEDNQTQTPAPEPTTCPHSNVIVEPASEATCTGAGKTEGKRCADCGEVLTQQKDIAALGHTTTTGTCSRCGVSFGSWSISYYVDDFGDPTNEGYVYNTNYIIGTFSNSATTDSTLYVEMLYDGEYIAIFLYEYGRNLVKNSSSRYTEGYEITMKDGSGQKHSLSGTMYCGGDRILIDDSYVDLVLNALCSGEKISFYIVLADRTTTTYLFSVETNNFKDRCNQLFP